MAAYIKTITAGGDQVIPRTRTSAVSDSDGNNLDTILSGIDDDIEAIEGKIPSQASSSNQLADKSFVNSSISTNTADYISNNGEPFASVAQLEAYSGTVTSNDYAFVTGTDSSGNTYFDRYKATVNGATVTWSKEYRLNNSSFTSAQWSAISSGITSGLVALIGTALQPSALNTYRTSSAQDVIDAEKASASVVSSHTSNSDIHVTANQKTAWSGKQDAISDLSSIRSGASAGSTAVQPSAISDMATKTWVGGQGYLTEHQSLSGYATQSWVNQRGFLTSVDWTSILNKPQTFTPSAHNHDDRYYTKEQTDSAISGHHDSTKENTSNKVTSMTAQSTNTQYPSAKCVYDELSQLNEDLVDKEDKGKVTISGTERTVTTHTLSITEGGTTTSYTLLGV